MTPDDPRGLRPIIRLIAAITCTFSFSAWLGLTIVGYLVPPEPTPGRLARWFAAIVCLVSAVWGIWLYRELKREGR